MVDQNHINSILLFIYYYLLFHFIPGCYATMVEAINHKKWVVLSSLLQKKEVFECILFAEHHA